MFSPDYATMASALSGFVAMRDQRAATVFGKVKILLNLNWQSCLVALLSFFCSLSNTYGRIYQLTAADLKSKAIYEPFRDELFTAELKRGAFLNGPPGMLSFSASAENRVFFGRHFQY